MNKRVIIFVISHAFLLFSKEVDKYFLLSLFFNSNPFLYESVNNGYIYSFIGGIDTGFGYNNFSISIGVNQNHYRYEQLGEKDLRGYFNILNSYLKFSYIFDNIMILKFSIGFGWQKLDFIQKENFIMKDYFSPLIKFDLIFTLHKYVWFEIINSLNIFISEKILPFYMTIFRINIKPYIDFLYFFIDNGIMLITYKNNEITFNSILFLWSTGIKLDFNILINKNRKIEISKLKNEEEEIDKSINNKENNDKKYEKEEEEKAFESEKEIFFKKFLNIKENEIINLNIKFTIEDTIIDEKSLELLDWLTEYLKTKKINIAIGAYIEFSGNPELDILKNKKRSNFIKNYLINNGIEGNRVKIFASGKVYSKEIEDKYKMIDIKILKK